MSEWISVVDRMPSCDMHVVSMTGLEGCCSVGFAHWDGEEWWFVQPAHEYSSIEAYLSNYDIIVTHWMPLPDPPEVT